MMTTTPLRTKLNWDFGTGYDLFLSLHVLHNPDPVGLRPSWAASVRARLPIEHRQTLAMMDAVMPMPYFFVHTLPSPKSSDVVLEHIAQIPASMRLQRLYLRETTKTDVRELLLGTTVSQKWTRQEKHLITEFLQLHFHNFNTGMLDPLYHLWSHRTEFGEAIEAALRSYVDNFFAEEEVRILPVLKQGLSHAQMRSGSLALTAMLEELSSGIRYRDLTQFSNLYLAPSFWNAPYLFFDELGEGSILMLFAARPENMALIPGEIVPDGLINGLKSLSDPTRLRILRHLAQSPQSAAELSRALRLRPPTVAHHIQELRMAGLVQVIVGQEGDRQYATRFDGIDTINELLDRFLHGD